ncbi:hypothetical protein J4464_04990 [Candidatus Woesearchaeota archaeon]|nr:hypothetical protein [Candidatus Woesearchaeota archaeon]
MPIEARISKDVVAFLYEELPCRPYVAREVVEDLTAMSALELIRIAENDGLVASRYGSNKGDLAVSVASLLEFYEARLRSTDMDVRLNAFCLLEHLRRFISPASDS